MKKGDMSLALIIGAVIALLILVIISVLIFKTGGKIVEGTACESLADGALCIPVDDSCNNYQDYDGKPLHNNPAGTCRDGEKCCSPLY